MLDLLGLPEAASAHAGQIDHLLSLVHWLMLRMDIAIVHQLS